MRWNIQANRGCTKCYFQTEKLPVKDELSCSKKKKELSASVVRPSAVLKKVVE
jgi:hypothetical protein